MQKIISPRNVHFIAAASTVLGILLALVILFASAGKEKPVQLASGWNIGLGLWFAFCAFLNHMQTKKEKQKGEKDDLALLTATSIILAIAFIWASFS